MVGSLYLCGEERGGIQPRRVLWQYTFNSDWTCCGLVLIRHDVISGGVFAMLMWSALHTAVTIRDRWYLSGVVADEKLIQRLEKHRC